MHRQPPRRAAPAIPPECRGENREPARTSRCRAHRLPKTAGSPPSSPRARAERHCRDRREEEHLPAAWRWPPRPRRPPGPAPARRCQAGRFAAARPPSNRRRASAPSRDTEKRGPWCRRRIAAAIAPPCRRAQDKRDGAPRSARSPAALHRLLAGRSSSPSVVEAVYRRSSLSFRRFGRHIGRDNTFARLYIFSGLGCFSAKICRAQGARSTDGLRGPLPTFMPSRLHAPHVSLFAILARPGEVRSGEPQAHVRIPRLPPGRARGLNTPHRRKLAFDRLETAFDVIGLCAARADDERSADAAKALTLLHAPRPAADKGAGGRYVLLRQEPLFGLPVPFVVLAEPVHRLEITQRAPGGRSPDAIAVVGEITEIVQLRLYPDCIGTVRGISLRLRRRRERRLPDRPRRLRFLDRGCRLNADRVFGSQEIGRTDQRLRRAANVGRAHLYSRRRRGFGEE